MFSNDFISTSTVFNVEKKRYSYMSWSTNMVTNIVRIKITNINLKLPTTINIFDCLFYDEQAEKTVHIMRQSTQHTQSAAVLRSGV